MPRVGGEFVAPYPDVIPDTTIESEVHNGTVADLVLDANTARPITAGGTGATSPAAARDNLDAMVAGAQVTNYNSHVWENGSFWSAAGATGAPNASASFTGSAALVNDDQNYVRLLATDQATGLHYTRVKNATWIDWAGADIGDKVSRGGDTMSGPLTLSGDPAALLHAATKQYVDIAISSIVGGLFPAELRFTRASSQHMTRLFSTNNNSQAWTMSMWVKRVGTGLGTHQALFGVETAGNKQHIAFSPNPGHSGEGANRFVLYGGAAGDIPNAVGPVYVDTDLWLNIVWTCPAAAGLKSYSFYINGVPVGTALANDAGLNGTTTHYIGQPGYYPDVIMKDVVFVDGAQVPATSFGESVGGVWTPKNYTGPFGANGFKLNFGNRYAPASTNLGRDISGNNNHWTAVNFP